MNPSAANSGEILIIFMQYFLDSIRDQHKLPDRRDCVALQLRFSGGSEFMGNHDFERDEWRGVS